MSDQKPTHPYKGAMVLGDDGKRCLYCGLPRAAHPAEPAPALDPVGVLREIAATVPELADVTAEDVRAIRTMEPAPESEEPPREPECPKCGFPMERDEVDIGVGTAPVGPYGCFACGYVEDAPRSARPAEPAPCKPNVTSSRVCEVGTKSCTVRHETRPCVSCGRPIQDSCQECEERWARKHAPWSLAPARPEPSPKPNDSVRPEAITAQPERKVTIAAPESESLRKIAEEINSLAYAHAVTMHESIVSGRGAVGWRDEELTKALLVRLEEIVRVSADGVGGVDGFSAVEILRHWGLSPESAPERKP